MTTNTDTIIKDFFQKNCLDDVSKDELLKFHDDYPFSSIGGFLYAQKLKHQNDFQYRNAISHTSLYFNNQRWLYNLLNEVGETDFAEGLKLPIVEKIVEPLPTMMMNIIEADIENDPSITTTLKEQSQNVSAPSTIKEEDLLELSYKQYHTIDYFASQGIKLGQIDSADKLGQKVKTFTEWLKTMKNIQKAEAKNHSQKLQEVGDDAIEATDTDKNTTIVLTETMAEIYQKQGLTDKAIEVYNKLSLQNPLNSHIFADRINALKDTKL